VSLDLAFDDGQQAIADAVAQFCADHCDDDVVKASTGSLPRDLWRGLAELGVLGVLTPDAGGGALEVVAAVESLGRAAFPGPLAANFVATLLLGGAERAAVANGESIACLGSRPLIPWAPEADVFFEVAGERVFRAYPTGESARVETLGAEPWGRGDLTRSEEFADGPIGLALARLVRAAQVAALGRRLIDDASEHAAARKQFGRPIGDFQAVAFPLAACAIRLDSAAMLARAAAFHFDVGPPGHASRFGAAAHVSACDAALEAAYVGHQVLGAVGITLEGPVFHLSRRIRQLAAEAPTRNASRDVLLADASFGPSFGSQAGVESVERGDAT
jgi:alkylation response protein AidB-like acyl-CoA dehydrogenase